MNIKAMARTAQARDYIRQHFANHFHNLTPEMAKEVEREVGISKPTWYKLRTEFMEIAKNNPRPATAATAEDDSPQNGQAEFVVSLPPDLPPEAREGVNRMIAHIHQLEHQIALLQAGQSALTSQLADMRKKAQFFKKVAYEIFEAV